MYIGSTAHEALTISCGILTQPHFAAVSRHFHQTRRSAGHRVLRRWQLLLRAERRAGMTSILQKWKTTEALKVYRRM